MNNSLTNKSYTEDNSFFRAENNVSILNPLSNELAVMRQTLLFGGLESVLYNINRKNFNLKLYEFGKVYTDSKKTDASNSLASFHENEQLALFVSGSITPENWQIGKEKPVDFYFMKAYLNNIFSRAGINVRSLSVKEISNDIFSEGLEYYSKDALIASLAE